MRSRRCDVIQTFLSGLASLIVVAASCATLHAEAVHWRFQPGEKLRYVRTQERVMDTSSPGANARQTLTRVTTMTLVVEKVEADGSARMRMTIDRIEYRQQTPQGEVEFDSRSDKPLAGRSEQVARNLKPLVDAEFVFLLTPQGEVKDFQFTEKTKEALKAIPPAAADSVSESTLKLLVPTLPLPKGDLASATPWENEAAVPLTGLGTIKMRMTFRPDGKEKQGERELCRIATSGAATFEPRDRGQIRVEVKDYRSKGTALFDGAQGRLIERVDQITMKMSVRLNERGVQQDSTSTETLRLEPADRKP